MCNRPNPLAPEIHGTAVIEAKENMPAPLALRVLLKMCACGEGYVGRVASHTLWEKAELICHHEGIGLPGCEVCDPNINNRKK